MTKRWSSARSNLGMSKREASKASRRFESVTVGVLEHPDGGFGEYVIAPQSKTFIKGGRTFVMDSFLEQYLKRTA